MNKSKSFSQAWWCIILLLGLGLESASAAGVDPKLWRSGDQKFSGVIIPGFASTRLRSWSLLDCPFSPLDFNPLDPVWLDLRKVISVPQCWMKCMMLDPYNQTDHPECKSRPDSGVSAITEMDPGYFTGPLSSVWKEWVSWCVEFGVDAESIVAAPYDWRLAGPVLEERDLYFHRLRLTFETLRKLRGGPSLVFAHSLGNNVFRYFLEWLKQEVPPKLYTTWIDDHIFTYHALGAPFLGAPDALKGVLSGVTFGLPISEGTARIMLGTFSSGLWMLPFSDNKPLSQRNTTKTEGLVAPDWPVNVLEVDMPTSGVLYPGESFENGALAALANYTVPIQRFYSAQKISDGTSFKEMGEFDPQAKLAFYQLKKYYLDNPLFNPLTPWERPPIKNVFCMYGINLKTEVGYQLSPSGKPYPDNWIIKDVIYETDGGSLQTRSGLDVDGKGGVASGDSTVPYHSLSWCKRWLGPRVNITRAPQTAHEGSDIQEVFDVEHEHGGDLVYNGSRDSRIKYITYYEDAVGLAGKKTAVWEFDKIDHRNLVRSPVLLRELLLENVHNSHPQAVRSFVSKARRVPLRDEDCYWDYSKAKCGLLDYCEYRYVFGDVHLGQSCRLKASTDKDILQYF
ncbi:phospholipid--sterol O-acyltransferase [Selaginella moellendorffii]|uniref:phospholipid--sterol O-acyltransferase n=1 Tax=Selaginella moellendorffii TaxID=88036 RepID=UPI000D1C9163|nr:phospholipid--sterol O-acyltransferase [Selaginella moellendorffii]|eukprot:XP_024532484.1 phospholipid--sterol O-acyltransferase [Selaginella moellendorffii]